jgi:hypothetical protein
MAALALWEWIVRLHLRHHAKTEKWMAIRRNAPLLWYAVGYALPFIFPN